MVNSWCRHRDQYKPTYIKHESSYESIHFVLLCFLRSRCLRLKGCRNWTSRTPKKRKVLAADGSKDAKISESGLQKSKLNVCGSRHSLRAETNRGQSEEREVSGQRPNRHKRFRHWIIDEIMLWCSHPPGRVWTTFGRFAHSQYPPKSELNVQCLLGYFRTAKWKLFLCFSQIMFLKPPSPRKQTIHMNAQSFENGWELQKAYPLTIQWQNHLYQTLHYSVTFSWASFAALCSSFFYITWSTQMPLSHFPFILIVGWLWLRLRSQCIFVLFFFQALSMHTWP